MAKVFVKNFIFQPKRKKAAEWKSENPILRDGEFGVVTDGADGEWLKVGDGVTAWKSLPFKKGPKGDPFTYSDFTPEQLAALKGEKGDPFTYADFTPEQLASLKGKDGIDGKDGTNGKDGYTPQKGVDYFTEEDIAELNIPSVDQTYAPDSNNAQSGKTVSEAVAIEQKRADNTFANALKGTASGSEIFLTDVSPVVDDMNVSVLSNSISDLSVVKVIKKNGAGEFIAEYTTNPDGTVEGVTSFVGNENKRIKIWDGSVAEEADLQLKTAGANSAANPYLIDCAEKLAYIARAGSTATNGKYYELTCDIYLNNVTGDEWYTTNSPRQWFDTTNTTTARFQGKLNGNGHVIYGIYIDDNARANAGLFMMTEGGASISNLGIEKSYIKGKTNVGAFAGSNNNWYNLDLINCYSSDTVILSSYDNYTSWQMSIGGLIGVLNASNPDRQLVTIENCYSAATGSDKDHMGGLFGKAFTSADKIRIANCYSSQDSMQMIGFTNYIGGGTFKNNYSKASTGKRNGSAFDPLVSSELTTAKMTGDAAYENMSGFDFNTVWYVNEYEFPKLRVFAYDAISLTSNTDNVKIYCEYNKDTNNCINSKENISNKTNFLSLHSTDKEYPTAKAVYNLVHQTAESERNYADSTFTTITAFNALKSIVDGKKVTYRGYAQDEKLIVEKSKVYIFKAYPSDKAAINLWVTDSSGTETQAYAEGDKLFSDCTTGILISPADTYNYSGILFIGITGKLSITNLSPFYGRRFANWLHSDIKNLFLKSTASDGMAVWTIAL